MELDIQPPLLSKLNILNLGFFNSLQCHAIEFKLGIDPKAIVKATTSAYKSYSIATLERVWHALFGVMEKVPKEKGASQLTLPHAHTRVAQNVGMLGFSYGVIMLYHF